MQQDNIWLIFFGSNKDKITTFNRKKKISESQQDNPLSLPLRNTLLWKNWLSLKVK